MLSLFLVGILCILSTFVAIGIAASLNKEAEYRKYWWKNPSEIVIFFGTILCLVMAIVFLVGAWQQLLIIRKLLYITSL